MKLATEDTRPLCYADLRRLLGLVILLSVATLLIWRLADTILLFVVVFLMATVLNPVVLWLEARRVKRGLAVILVILALLGLLVAVVWLVVPVVLEQVNQLTEHYPQIRENILTQIKVITDRYPALDKNLPETKQIMEAAKNQTPGVVTAVLKTGLGLVGGLFMAVVALLLLTFTLADPKPLVAGLLNAVPHRHRPPARRSLIRIAGQMGAWIRATLINGLITGTLTGLLLTFIGVKPSFVFGILAFCGEFVPNVGPIVASVPALFVALGQGIDKAGLALLCILGVQMFSGNVLVPLIMGKQMELHPAVITFFALGMGALFGIVGAILAVPTAATLKVLIDEFYIRPQRARHQIAAVEPLVEKV